MLGNVSVFVTEFPQKDGVELIHVFVKLVIVYIVPSLFGFGFGVGVVHNESLWKNRETVSQKAQMRNHFNLVLAVPVKPFVVVGCHRIGLVVVVVVVWRRRRRRRRQRRRRQQ